MKESKRVQREIAKETGASPGEINEAFATRMLIDFGTAIDARNADIQRTSPERPQVGRAEVSAETRSLETSAIQKEPPSAQHQDTPNGLLPEAVEGDMYYHNGTEVVLLHKPTGMTLNPVLRFNLSTNAPYWDEPEAC